MNTKSITNEIQIFTAFERQIASNGEASDDRVTLCAAPTTSGAVIFYLVTNGDPVPVTIYLNEWYWSYDGFGLAGLSVSDTLSVIQDIKSWYQRDNEFDNGELEHFWLAVEVYQAVHEDE